MPRRVFPTTAYLGSDVRRVVLISFYSMARTLRTATKSTASEGLGSSTADLYVESELSEVEFSDDASASDSDYENGVSRTRFHPFVRLYLQLFTVREAKGQGPSREEGEKKSY